MQKQAQLIDRAVLQSLHGLAELKPADFNELAAKTFIEECLPGRRLFSRGRRDNWVFFLLEGRLRLDGPGNQSHAIDAGEEQARQPLAPGQPRQFSATAEGHVRFIRIDATLLEVLSGELNDESYRLEEYSSDDELPQNRLFYAIFRDFMEDKLELPVLPEVTFRVREAMRDPECGADKVARIIQMDPVVSARLIQAANSPLYGVETPIINTRGAVTYLGLETTRNLVMSYTLRQLFETPSRLLKDRMLELWRHSAMTGAIAYVLAGMTTGLDRDRAMLLGLLHDIGSLPVIHYTAHHLELYIDPTALQPAIDALRGQVGAMVLRSWGFTDQTVGVILEAESWQRDPDGHADYTDLVLLAQAIEMGETWDDGERPPLNELPAFAKIAHGKLDDELIAEIIVEAREEVADTLRLLA